MGVSRDRPAAAGICGRVDRDDFVNRAHAINRIIGARCRTREEGFLVCAGVVPPGGMGIEDAAEGAAVSRGVFRVRQWVGKSFPTVIRLSLIHI